MKAYYPCALPVSAMKTAPSRHKSAESAEPPNKQPRPLTGQTEALMPSSALPAQLTPAHPAGMFSFSPHIMQSISHAEPGSTLTAGPNDADHRAAQQVGVFFSFVSMPISVYLRLFSEQKGRKIK